MLKKITLSIFVIVVLAGILAARDRGQAAGRGPAQGRLGAMRAGFGVWFDELAEAYEQQDKEKMGRLIEDMRQRRQRFQGGMSGPDRPARPGTPDRPDRPMRPGPGRSPQGEADASFMASSPMPRTETEKKILQVLDDMNQNQRRGMMNVPVEDGRLLRLLTEAVGAKHVIEIGTSNGYSGIWFCLALQKTGGKLTTHEIDSRRASLARENFKRAGVDKLVTLVEGDAHENVTKLKGTIDVVFIDADKEGYTDYLNKLLPLVRPGGLILAHNISPRMADPKFLEAITQNPDLESMLHGQMSVTLKKR
ncbi:MAG: O-methyltransferase [Phycisphaerales bacterium]|nr:MAG: O-methyltransferase [Phycisphaerales bacterium]